MQRYHYLITAWGAICIATLVMVSTQSTKLPVDSLERRKLLYQSPASVMNAYKAPLHLCNNPMRRLNEYIVFLHQGYSLEQHKQAVGNGTDFDSALVHIIPERKMHGLYYSADLDAASLTSVRADIGGDMVECEVQGFFIKDVAPPMPYDYYMPRDDELEALLFQY